MAKQLHQMSDSQLLTMRDEPIGRELVLETVSSIRHTNVMPSPLQRFMPKHSILQTPSSGVQMPTKV